MAALSRLTTALSEGLSLGEGPVAVFRPPVGYDVSGVPQAQARIVQGFFPDHIQWQAAGFAMGPGDKPCTAAVVVMPRSKALARSLVARACAAAPSGLIVVDGDKTDGIDSLFREVRKAVGDVQSITKAHGRLFWFPASEDLSGWKAPAPVAGPDGFFTTVGVFSEGGVDKGSAALVRVLPADITGEVADLGAGWGYLAQHVLQSDAVSKIDLIEAEALALDCARLNVTDPRAQFHWADALTWDGGPYDAVISNPPFHTTRTGDPDLGRGFIATAARILKPRGTFYMVANRHLPYEAALADKFASVKELDGNGAFKIFQASRPKR